MTSRLRCVLCAIITGLFFSTAFTANAGAGNSGHALSARIAKARDAGMVFREVSLFAPATGSKHTALLEKETTLQPLADRISGLYESHPEAITLTLRSDEGTEYKLEMLRAHPTAEYGNFGYIDAAGRHKAPFTEGLHYQGSIAGTEQSLAAMSVFANGDVMLLFANDDGNFVVGKLEDGSGKYILYNDREMRSRPYAPCGVKDDSYPGAGEHKPAAKTTNALMCNKVSVYWEVVYNIFTSKSSSLTNTQNYITGLFNQVQVMYANENIALELKTLYIWTVQDDYPTTSSSLALDRFMKYWNALNNGFDGDIAHLLTRDNAGNGGGNGGLAYLDILCSRQYAYAYSDIYGTYQAVPTWSWDVEVITHETGHNLGSHHTHWCGWMTGAGGTCGSIDNCTTQEAASGCATCGSTYLNSAPTSAWKGTVMSYCHLVSRGISLANGFGPLPGAAIRSRVSGGACLRSVISAKLTPAPICAGDGAVSLVYAGNNFGVGPYTYNWSGNVHTQNLANLITPGAYNVSIIDSNGCIASYTANLIRRPAPGDGIAPVEKMPICCRDATIPLTLKASVPQDLTGCESVYWLRSSAPFAAIADAAAYFDTTQAANILASTNNNRISSSVGATLDVQPPSSCAAPITYYYTPVSVLLPKAADSFTYIVTGTSFQNLGTQIGNYAVLPDQSTMPSDCDLLDTPVSQSLIVNVTNYTGRANKMRIVVQDISDRVLYEALGLAGNGTYTIPASSISGSLLQDLTIIVFDFNCTTSGASQTCIASQAAFSASRKVVYGMHPLSAGPGCTMGKAIRVDFAPDFCTKLDVNNIGITQADATTLYPNPASKSVTLKFTTAGNGISQVKVTDMLGKAMLLQETAYSAGQHHQLIDVHAWAKGVYFVNISGSQAFVQRLKLVVE